MEARQESKNDIVMHKYHAQIVHHCSTTDTRVSTVCKQRSEAMPDEVHARTVAAAQLKL